LEWNGEKCKSCRLTTEYEEYDEEMNVTVVIITTQGVVSNDW